MTGNVIHLNGDASLDINGDINMKEDESCIYYIQAVKDAKDELIAAYVRRQDMAHAYKDAIKAVAEKANIDKGVLAKYIKALADDTMEDEQNHSQQLEMLFSIPTD